MLHEHHFRAMNTSVGLWVWADVHHDVGRIRRSLLRAEDVFVGVERELSRFLPASGLSLVNAAAGRGRRTVSRLLCRVLRAALDAADDSDGIYDPTLLNAMERIGYDRSFETLDVHRDAAVHAAGAAPGAWRRVALDCGVRQVSLPAGLAIDLGGIAKGWTVDAVATALAPLGPVLVDAGGDLRAIGTVGDEPWPIAIQDPFAPDDDRSVVRLASGALATSSVGGRRWSRGGREFHHLLDPRTGTSANSDLHTVTVHAARAITADVAAKVALVLGREDGAAYLAQRHLSGLLTDTLGREFVVGHFAHERTPRHAVIH